MVKSRISTKGVTGIGYLRAPNSNNLMQRQLKTENKAASLEQDQREHTQSSSLSSIVAVSNYSISPTSSF